MKTFRLNVRLRNNLLAERREAEGKSAREVARAIGISYSTYLKLEGLKESPLGARGWRPVALAIATYFGEVPEDLWPEEVLAVEAPAFEGRFNAEDLAPYLPPPEFRPDRLLEDREQRALANAALDREDGRHRTVLLARLKGSTLEESGALVGVSQERARQMIAKTIARLQVRIIQRRRTGEWGERRVPRVKALRGREDG